jgi:hypothetical protein
MVGGGGNCCEEACDQGSIGAMRAITKLVPAMVAAAVIVLAAPAHADDQGYLNYLASHGVPPWPAGPGLKGGHDAYSAIT